MKEKFAGRRTRCFTLIEILIVVAIIAIITPIIFTFYKQFSSKEKENISSVSVLNRVQAFEQAITIDIYNAEEIEIEKEVIDHERINTDMKIKYGDFSVLYSVRDGSVTKKIFINDDLKSSVVMLANVHYLDIYSFGYLVSFNGYFIIDSEREPDDKNLFEYGFSVYGRNLNEEI